MSTLPFDLLGDRGVASPLSPAEIKRYARHLIMPTIAVSLIYLAIYLRLMRAGMVEFKRLTDARQTAAADLDAAVTALADAYFRLRAGSQLVPASVPEGLRLPQGYLGRDLAADRLAHNGHLLQDDVVEQSCIAGGDPVMLFRSSGQECPAKPG